MNDAGQFYTNRVLKDSKDSRASKDWKAPAQSHVDWTKAWVSTLINLHALVKQYHTTGLVWNPKGGDAKATKGKLASNSNMAQETICFYQIQLHLSSIMNSMIFVVSATNGGPAAPPPPPPPPPPAIFDEVSTGSSGDKARNALFDDLNKGDDVSKGIYL